MPGAAMLPLDTVAKLLCPRRHRSGHADGLDVRSHNLDRADTDIVTQEHTVNREPYYSLYHVQRLPFWRRAPGRWISERTLAGALACRPAAWSCGSSRGDIHAHRALAGTPPSGLSTGAFRLAVVYGLAARLLRRPRCRGDCAPESAGTGLVRHRCRNDAAPVHWHPQRMGCRDLHGLRTLPVAG